LASSTRLRCWGLPQLVVFVGGGVGDGNGNMGVWVVEGEGGDFGHQI
jgi:hypothetical protein